MTFRKYVRNTIRKLGYEVSPIPWTPNDQARSKLFNKESYARIVSSAPVFCPWVEDSAFAREWTTASKYTLVSLDRCYTLYSFARNSLELKGDFAECGVYKGGTAILLASLVKGREKVLHLFDSFEGLPDADSHDNVYGKGDFSDTSELAVRSRMKAGGSDTVLHVGWIPQTFAGMDASAFSLVHVDVDLFQPALDCCSFFYPRLVRGGVMIFDDYGFPACLGEKKAVDDYFADKQERPISLTTGQAVVVKL